MKIKNIHHINQNSGEEELFESLLVLPNIKLERIVSYGQITPKGDWYDQNHHEWVLLVKGKSEIKFKKNNQVHSLVAGDYLFLEAHNLHRIDYTSKDAIWLALHFK